MKHDFRTVEQAVRNTVKEMDQRDTNWKWRAVVQKSQIKVFWGYLEYLEEKAPYFIITDGEEKREECSEDDEFIVLRDAQGHYMNGKIVGEEKIWQEGNLEKCVVSLMNWLQRRVNNIY